MEHVKNADILNNTMNLLYILVHCDNRPSAKIIKKMLKYHKIQGKN